MNLLNWSMWGFWAVILYCLIRWKPKNRFLIAARITLFIIELIQLSLIIFFNIFCMEAFNFIPVKILGVLLVVSLWVGFIYMIKKDSNSTNRSPVSTEKIIIGINLFSLLFLIFKWPITNLVTVFLFMPLYWLMAALFLATCLWALVYGAIEFKKVKWHAIRPLAVCLLTGLMAVYVPLDDIEFYGNFWLLRLPREGVVHQIESGQIKIERGIQHLSGLRRFLSVDGEFEVQKHDDTYRVMFFTFMGILSSFSGYVYCSDDKPPTGDDFGMYYPEIHKLKDHWYFASSRN